LDAGKLYSALPPIQTSDGRTLLIGQGRCNNNNGSYDFRVYILQGQDSYLRAFGFANLLPNSIAYPPTSALYNPRFAYQIPGFVLQLSTGAPLNHPPAPNQSLSGLWRGLSMSGGELKNAYAYFYPDGRAFFASRMPMNGFADLPTDADAVVTPTYWGRYAYDGLQGEIQFPYRGNDTFPFTSQSTELTIVTTGTPHQFAPQTSVDGFTFEGTYLLHLPNETPTLSLSQAGRFVDGGVLKYVDHWIYPFRVSDQPGDGSYAVTNFTIVFRYADGRLLRLPFSGLGLTAGDPSPATLYIGTEDDSLTLSGDHPPRLTAVVAAANAGHLTIRWPAATTGYVLEAADSLVSPIWKAAPEQPAVDGTDNVVTIESTGVSRFFRLVKQ
jgi:hypothetical protein